MTHPAGTLTGRRPPAAHALAGAVTRNNLRLFRNSASLVSALVIPGMMMLAFWVVFGHAAKESGFDYALFLMAGSMFQAVMFTAGGSCMALAVDVESGLIGRLRAMPIPALVAVGARMITDLVRSLLSVLAVVAIGLLCGAKPAGVMGLLLACLLALLMGEVLVLAFCGLALRSRRHPVQMAGLIQGVEMPLLMLSSAFIPLSALPEWIEPVIAHMPFTVMIETNRAFLMGRGPGSEGWEALAWLVLGLVLGGWWVAAAFRRQR
ncbi:ABC transporter permease [Corynebacterium hansenii]|uniref:Transport permease protein n=1 Tax=Corynebacterium hansenii TaxID=394964 RepID=A0ABV7ZLI5_9CORY|nr:ABC transporter permease [Corynebacterium hansenii]WJY99040.1 Daunorubicin/doxorubicin resistance ABC transporter permease protein DrrB [Corynebacterium hansenii]